MLPVPLEADGVPVPAAEVAPAVAEVVAEPAAPEVAPAVAPAVAEVVAEPVPPAPVVAAGVPTPPEAVVPVLIGTAVPAPGVWLLLFEAPPPPQAARNKAPIMKAVTMRLNLFINILLSPFEHY